MVKQPIYNKQDFRIGQQVVLFIKDGSNAIRYVKDKNNLQERVIYVTVKNIGRKYITVVDKNNCTYDFDMTNRWLQKQNVGSIDYILFYNLMAIDEALKVDRCLKAIQEHLNRSDTRLTFEQCVGIANILGIQWY